MKEQEDSPQMSADGSRSKRVGRRLVAIAALALAVPFSSGNAVASPAEGEVLFSLKPGAESSLQRQGVRAWQSKAGRTVALPIVDIELLGSATVRTDGVLELKRRGDKARLRDLIVQIANGKTAISAKLGKRRLIFFRATGDAKVDATSVSLDKAQLSLAGKGAKALRQRFGLEQLSAGKIGTFDVNAKLPAPPKQPEKPAEPQGPVDPYAQQCALGVESKATGSATPAGSVPALGGAAVNGGEIKWGLKGDLRFYVVEISGGSLVPIAPAKVLNPPLPAPQIGTFNFPAGSGEFAINSPGDDTDDQAVVNGSGEVVICNSPHGFRVTVSNPTVVIDGDSSRLIVDVDTNMSGVWTQAQRVELGEIELAGASPFYNEAAKTATWTDLPVRLTEAGEEALQLCPSAPVACEYEEGDLIEPVTVTASTDSTVAWPFDAACTLSQTSTAKAWPTAPAAPLALPALTAPESVSTASVSWGLRNSLRKTVQTVGVFNLDGATQSDANMEGLGKFFTWPGTTGLYEAGTPGRLVLEGAGSVGLCNTTHGYGTVLSNPTLVIDGTKSRLSMDIATRLGVSWTSGRVDVATLEIGKVVVENLADTPSTGEETLRWTFPDLGADDLPGGTEANLDDNDSDQSSVKLTAAGASAFSLIGLKAGIGLNKVVVSIVRETD
jgi:hypothetical protein